MALGDNASDPGQVKAFNVSHGYVIDDGSPTGKPIPVLVRYFNYLVALCHGDFGIYGVGTSHQVTDLIAPALPVTLQLTFLGLFIAVLISFPLGVLAAIYRDRCWCCGFSVLSKESCQFQGRSRNSLMTLAGG